MARPHSPAAPVRITTARTSRADDIAGRQRRYLISMAIRCACFVGAVVADGWLRWTLVVGAIVLPYVAVVFANSEEQRSDGFELRSTGAHAELTSGDTRHEKS